MKLVKKKQDLRLDLEMPSTIKTTDGGQAAVEIADEVTQGVQQVEIVKKAVENGHSKSKMEDEEAPENGHEQANNNSSSDQENHRPTESLPKNQRGKRRNRQVLDITLPAYQSTRNQSDGQLRDRRRRPRVDAENLEPTEKLFVGGLPVSFSEEELGEYFSQYGNVVESLTKEGRSFGFVTFASIEEANAALEIKTHKIGDRDVEVKRAIANTRAPPMVSPTMVAPMSGVFYPPFVYPSMSTMPMDSSYGMVDPGALSQTSYSSTSPTGSHFQNGNNYTNSQQDYEIDGQQQKKLFIGGLHWRTEDTDLRNYFSTFGQLTDAMVIKCPEKQKSRGFGFVVYASPEDAETVLHHPAHHEINSKVVDVKRAVSRDGQDIVDEAGRYRPVDKVFVGGIAGETTRKEVKDYFEENYEGCKVKNMDMKVDEDTGSHQSYAFITFAGTEKAKATDVVESICHSKYQRIGSHLCEVKKAHSKNAKFIKNAERRHHRESQYTPANCVYSTDYPPYPMYSPMFSVYPYPMSVPLDQNGIPLGADEQSTGRYENNGVWYPNRKLEEDSEIKSEESGKHGDQSNNNGGYGSPAEYSAYAYPGYYPNCGYVPASYSAYGNFYMSPQHVAEH